MTTSNQERDMRVMVLVKATEDSEEGFVRSPETAALMEAMGRFNDELRNAGILRDGDGLKPTSEGRRVAFDGAGRTVRQGAVPAGGRAACGLLAVGGQGY
jgi:hypothetical protein